MEEFDELLKEAFICGMLAAAEVVTNMIADNRQHIYEHMNYVDAIKKVASEL